MRIKHIVKEEKDYSITIFAFLFMNIICGLIMFALSWAFYQFSVSLFNKDVVLIFSTSMFYLSMFWVNIKSYHDGLYDFNKFDRVEHIIQNRR